MADQYLLNSAGLSGLYEDETVTATTNETSVLMVDVTATKAADKTIWANGALTYTVEVTNNADEDYETVTFTDVIDPTLTELVESSVQVNGIDVTYTYDNLTGLLTAEVGSIVAGATAEITFQVIKK